MQIGPREHEDSHVWDAASHGRFQDGGRCISADEGLTCCHDASLVNPIVSFDQRLDLVLTCGFGPTARERASSRSYMSSR